MTGRFFFINDRGHVRQYGRNEGQEARTQQTNDERRKLDAKEMINRKLQDKVIYFLSINLEFFLAPSSQKNFSLWAHRRHFSHTPLGKALQLTGKEKEKFYIALQGDPKKPETMLNALVNGDDALIRRYLNQHTHMVTTFTKFFGDPIIEEWYRTKGTKIAPVNLSLNKLQHAVFAYVKHLENEINHLVHAAELDKTIDIDGLLQHKNKTEISKLDEYLDIRLIHLLSIHLLLNTGLDILRYCHESSPPRQRTEEFIALLGSNKAVLLNDLDSGLDTFKAALGHYADNIFNWKQEKNLDSVSLSSLVKLVKNRW